MSNIAIKAEELSKLYRIGEIGAGTLSHDLNRWWHKVRGKEDPYSKLGEVNKRDAKGGGNYVWALKGIDFEVNQGEVFGIIGRNGAGKSTLLKVLSRVTKPTTGLVKAKGRIASLLEVGTGFHPDLTGRDNIFLNGAILGMTKAEIKRKFDDIVEFAGVERYVDTPVKRYSSGMYVRLAFAVAAHLESEILIVDEVLAVGDSDFQKKCMGKMGEVTSNEGRTVLFVSHNMAAVHALCKNTLVIENGKIDFDGEVTQGIHHYLELNRKNSIIDLADRKDRTGNQKMKFVRSWIETADGKQTDNVVSGQKISIVAELANNTKEMQKGNLSIAFAIYDYMGYQITDLSNKAATENIYCEAGKTNTIRCELPSLPLNEGIYRYNVFCTMNNEVLDGLEYAGFFQVNPGDFFGTGKLTEKNQGSILFNQSWKMTCAE